MWREAQDSFARALRDPELPVPESVAGTGGRPSRKRFDVYRNNVAVSLSEALAAAYPVCAALVGEAFFAAMARAYVQRHLPATPVLLDYGAAFADFVAGFGPAESLPYLADVARFEWAWGRAYHAADADSIDISALAALPADTAAEVRFRLHPSLRLLHTPWPAVTLWLAHQEDAPTHLPESLTPGDEWAMILRPELDVVVRRLDRTAHNFVGALLEGVPLSVAAETLGSAAETDLPLHLAALFETGAVTDLI